MQYSSFLKAIRVVWVMAFVGLTIDAAQTGREDMKIMHLSVEVTDAQYLALEKSTKLDAQEEATYIASVAIQSKADDVLAKSAKDIESLMQESEELMHETQILASEAEEAVMEMVATVDAAHLTAEGGVFYGPSGKETWYNLPMEGIIQIMRGMGYSEEDYPYYVREDGCKMLGSFIMCAANLEIRPRGTILDTSLGEAIVCDTGAFAYSDPTGVDIAVSW